MRNFNTIETSYRNDHYVFKLDGWEIQLGFNDVLRYRLYELSTLLKELANQKNSAASLRIDTVLKEEYASLGVDLERISGRSLIGGFCECEAYDQETKGEILERVIQTIKAEYGISVASKELSTELDMKAL